MTWPHGHGSLTSEHQSDKSVTEGEQRHQVRPGLIRRRTTQRTIEEGSHGIKQGWKDKKLVELMSKTCEIQRDQ